MTEIQQRAQHVKHALADKVELPILLKSVVKPFLNSFLKDDHDDDQIIQFLDVIEGYSNYIKYGLNDAEEVDSE
jgi:hypothetical protein